MQITFGPQGLLGLGSTLSPVLKARTALIVLGAGRGESAKLEVALIQNPVSVYQCQAAARAWADRQYEIGHYGRGLPLTRRYARIQVRIRGLEQRLPHVGSGPPGPVHPCSMRSAHGYSFLNRLGRGGRSIHLQDSAPRWSRSAGSGSQEVPPDGPKLPGTRSARRAEAAGR